MDVSCLFPKDLDEAREIQKSLQRRIKSTPLSKKIRLITAVDAAFHNGNTIATACTFEYNNIVLKEEVFSIQKTSFPYIPGFLAFREGPAIIDAIKKLQKIPDVIIFDGQGIAHPYGIGIASHIGVILDTPTIGCAKSRLVGNFEPPDLAKGAYSNLIYRDETVGIVLRTKQGVSPVFLSIGHKIDLQSCIRLIMHLIGKYRIPIPQRYADMLTKKIKKETACRYVS